jgi:hypothetical protein
MLVNSASRRVTIIISSFAADVSGGFNSRDDAGVGSPLQRLDAPKARGWV